MRHGSQRTLTMPAGAIMARHGATLHARYDTIADEPIPKRQIEQLVRQPRKWIYGTIAATLVAFIAAAASAGWHVSSRFAIDVPEFYAGCAGRAPALRSRFAIRSVLAANARIQQWLTKRCGWVVRTGMDATA